MEPKEIVAVVTAIAAVVTAIATTVIAIVALFTLVKAVREYARQGTLKRAEYFVIMRERLKENEILEKLCALLEKDDPPELRAIPFRDKRSLLGFFGEVALMMNSDLIKREVAYYMFSYYSIRCWQSDNFWSNVNRHSIYWRLFKNFAEEMLQIEEAIAEKKLKVDPKNYKL